MDQVETAKLFRTLEDCVKQTKMVWDIRVFNFRNITVTYHRGIVQVQGKMHPLFITRVMAPEEIAMFLRIMEDLGLSTISETLETTSLEPLSEVTRRVHSSTFVIQELIKQTLQHTLIGNQQMETSKTKST